MTSLYNHRCYVGSWLGPAHVGKTVTTHAQTEWSSSSCAIDDTEPRCLALSAKRLPYEPACPDRPLTKTVVQYCSARKHPLAPCRLTNFLINSRNEFERQRHKPITFDCMIWKAGKGRVRNLGCRLGGCIRRRPWSSVSRLQIILKISPGQCGREFIETQIQRPF